ncbi:hypothetical protein [Pedobacter sp. JY14-1]|uniref:hypothetical protein n=1 Tax=Pedobacter sp. JY14-1 TaxID=3034151 RepID=UPI0023E0D7E1|nr:hypothetical protein [Pedobacter sp. JY14-1]
MKYKLTLLFAAAIFILSCSKKDPDENMNPCSPLILVTKVSGMKHESNGSVSPVNMIFSYEYGRPIQITDGLKTTKFFYDSSINSVYKVEHTDSAASPVKRTLFQALNISDAGPIQVNEFHYEGNQLTFESVNDYTYTDGLVSKLQKTSDNIVLTQKYTWKDGNMITFDNGKGTVYRYKYNDKLNPFVNRFTRYQTGPVDFTSANLVTEIEEVTDGVSKISTMTYTYNPDGYPLTARSVNQEGTVTLYLTFEYQEFKSPCY